MADVDVWIAPESLLDDAGRARRLESLLTPDELERRDRMAMESGRRQQLLTRALQREVLSHHAPRVAPRDWRFLRSEAGRPSLAPPFDATGLHFNIAHTKGLVAMVVARSPHVGIDVEALDKRVPLPVARRYFSAREIDALFALPQEQQPQRFLRLWTLKEAYLKAVGEGLSGGLDRMTFTLDESGGIAFERADDPRAGHWFFQEFTPPGFRVALAYLAADGDHRPRVQLRAYSADVD
jgi:4'-phosphopantetheinyl transferase